MRVKLRYSWCGRIPPCFGRPSEERPEGLEEYLYKLTGRHWGLRGERVYGDHREAACDAAILFLTGYDVWLEPLDPPPRRPPELRSWRDLLRYTPWLDRLASRIASKRDFDSAFKAAVESLSEMFVASLEQGGRIDPEALGGYQALAEVFTHMLEFRLMGFEEGFRELERRRPWVDAAYIAFAPWRLFARHYTRALAELGKEAGRATLEKIRGLIARRGS
ncbi:hypothetical protein Pyrfu_0341 [Pyrolobus fumarii 1A]|uniref:Uncharacterized protein n=1 Tax=Pyrolobus fumarii (strain DSM 11204 / 1A) TaxID=694429 RepID=G0EFP2_PYRF1|nr:hypothetical protein [Pyrolobus fumarii]AEM38213.1 hypothetical protein Pyrfu_0341 [Pyrolobus fumarii 1A]